MSDFDTDESGIIEFREFVKMMTIKPCEEDTADDIEKVFNHIDQEAKGT
jgi:Ca2+-binding EF-hand superfamily protein